MNKFNENTSNSSVNNEPTVEKVYNEAVYKRMSYGNTMPDSRMLVFMIGFCLGMVFFYLVRSTGRNDNPFDEILSTERLTQLDSFLAYKSGLFEYVAGVRIGQLIVLLLCATSAIGGILAYGILGWCGFELGLMSFAAVYQYGITGLLFAVAMFLPHGIFYLISLLMLFNRRWKVDKKYYHNSDKITKGSWHKKVTELRRILGALLIFFVGVLSEIYINSELLRKIALIF